MSPTLGRAYRRSVSSYRRQVPCSSSQRSTSLVEAMLYKYALHRRQPPAAPVSAVYSQGAAPPPKSLPPPSTVERYVLRLEATPGKWPPKSGCWTARSLWKAWPSGRAGLSG